VSIDHGGRRLAVLPASQYSGGNRGWGNSVQRGSGAYWRSSNFADHS
jgi:hypothetical protein